MPVTDAAVALPALSLTDAPAERSAPSPVTVASAGAGPARPDRASPAVQRTVTSPRYQPLAFGAVAGAPLSVGAVVSTSIPPTVNGSLTLSAASTAVPPALWSEPSPSVRLAGQDSSPDRPSW